MDAAERDERTTPRWLRIPALLLVALVAAWLALSYTFALQAEQPAWARPYPWVWWFANWEMFTMLDDTSSLVGGEALIDGEWRPIDLEALFPTRWESGPRYTRPAFYEVPQWMQVFGEATCDRLPRTPEKVRFYRVVWKRELGRSGRFPPRGTRHRPLSEWTCGGATLVPKGVRL